MELSAHGWSCPPLRSPGRCAARLEVSRGDQDMRRRNLLTLAGMSVLATPYLARAAQDRVLKFIPYADLAILDPVWTSAYPTRNHGFMVFDTLYGQDAAFRPQPQMVAGAVVENDGKLWKLTLREGLMFHDRTPVLARDCVASIRRWGRRDAFGQALMRATAEVSASDDNTILFRLKAPFPMLPNALGKASVNMLPVMPERLAETDAFTQITEMIGSGPFRFLADERVSGAHVAYERFAEYRPRENGVPEWTAGPKIAYFDRVEWNVIADSATAAAAMQRGEADWWEKLDFDLKPLLERDNRLALFVVEITGNIGLLRMNQLFPPFDNPAIRRAVLGVVNQDNYMLAVAGSDRQAWRAGVGYFAPDSPMASQTGMQALTGARDFASARSDIQIAGYKDERVAAMVPTDVPYQKVLGEVAVDMLQKCGFNVEARETDLGTMLQRRASKAPVEHGGWSVFCTTFTGLDMWNPATNLPLRGNGADAWFGWPNAPRIEALRDEWFTASDLAAQKRIAAQIQAQAFADVPYLPLGMFFQSTVQQKSLTGCLQGLPVFWNVRRA
jgi:peptide/nickel transport system substrate-binding protein